MQRAAEPPLVSAECALGLPPLAVYPLVTGALGARAEVPSHLGPVAARWHPVVPARVDRDHRRADAQALAREPVVVLGVERGIGQHPIPEDQQRRQQQDRSELRGIVGRAECDRGTGDEVGVRIDRSGQLGPTACGVLAFGTGDEVSGGVTAVETGGIDGDGGSFGDQLALDRGRNGAFEEVEEAPPFNSRSWA